jgi:hypothetical protein
MSAAPESSPPKQFSTDKQPYVVGLGAGAIAARQGVPGSMTKKRSAGEDGRQQLERRLLEMQKRQQMEEGMPIVRLG